MSNTIDIYSRQYCDACTKAEALVKASSPESHGAVLTIHDVTDDTSVKMTPILMIGDTEIDGYNEGQINDALTALYDSLAPASPPVDTTPPVDAPPVDPAPPAPQSTVPLPDITDVAQTSAISPKAALVLGAVVGFFGYLYLSKH